ncbi:MAG: UvrD-helicase domain-containing protein [Lentisphaeria bacterium]|nr:UvrD-helicase domain-containing protein [Lentisphaeria bacterium]
MKQPYSLEPGRYLIEASAGTGKTYTITRLFLQLVRDRGIAPARILVTTFSRAAAAELKERLRKILDDEMARLEAMPRPDDLMEAAEAERQRLRVHLAASSFDEMCVSTIHGFCQRMLRDFSLEAGVSPEMRLIGSDDEIKEKLIRQYWREHWPELMEAGVSLRSLLEHLVRISPDVRVEYADDKAMYAHYAACFQYLQAELPREKSRQGVVSFDDLIGPMRDALCHPQGGKRLADAVGNRFQAVFIDEFQDTSQAQFDIFDACFPAGCGHIVYLIGDPKQSIYAFRNANIYTYLRAKQALPPDHIHTMDENYRSSPAMIRAVNFLFTGDAGSPRGTETANAMLQNGIPFVSIAPGGAGAAGEKFHITVGDGPLTAPVRLRHVTAGMELYQAAADVADLLNSKVMIRDKQQQIRPLSPGDIAVLLPSNEQVEKLVKLLRLRRINAVSVRARQVFATPVAASFELLLRLWLEPGDFLLRGFLLLPPLSLSAAEVDALANDVRRETFRAQWLELHCRCAGRWREDGLPAALNMLLDAPVPGHSGRTVREHILMQEQGERALTDLLHLQEILHQQAAAQNLMPGEIHIMLRDAVAGRIRTADATADDDDNPFATRIDSSRAAVSCMTMHHAKGLEFPVVVLPFAAAGPAGRKSARKPYAMVTAEDGVRRCRFYGSADGGSDAFSRACCEEELRSQLRLLYVALTRAQYLLYLYLPPEETAGPAVVSAGSVLQLPPDPEQSVTDRMELVLTRQTACAAWCRQGEPGLIECWDGPAGPPVTGPEPAGAVTLPELSAAPMPSAVDHAWRVMSYSGFGFVHQPAPPLAEDPDAPFMAFPRGAGTGDLLHGILEKLTPAAGQSLTFRQLADGSAPQELERLLTHGLKNSGLAPELLPLLQDGLRRAVATPLPVWGKALCAIEPGRAMAEMEFELAVPQRVSLQKVLAVLQQYPPLDDPALWPEYQSPEETVTGVLTGYIDLIFENGGRYWIVDWKTNDLGPRWADYTPDAVLAAMGRNGYLLQAYFYAAALYRSLIQRLDGDFCFERDFGGVFYLFPRGMDAARPGCGVWYGRPEEACLRQLLALFQEGSDK